VNGPASNDAAMIGVDCRDSSITIAALSTDRRKNARHIVTKRQKKTRLPWMECRAFCL